MVDEWSFHLFFEKNTVATINFLSAFATYVWKRKKWNYRDLKIYRIR